VEKNQLSSKRARVGQALMVAFAGLAGCTPSGADKQDDVIEQRQSALTNPLPNASGDPSLFGFGYSQLAIIDGSTLQTLASPVRVQDAPWTTRWLSPLTSAPPVIVAGDFWHGTDGKAYLLSIINNAVTVQNPPEIPSVASWPAIGSAQALPTPPTGTILDAAAGDFLNQGKDQLVVITSTRIAIYTAPTTIGGAWTKSSDLAIPTTATGVAAGEFWAGPSDDEEARYRSAYVRDVNDRGLYDQGIGHGPRGKDEICLLRSDGKLGFYRWSAGAGNGTHVNISGAGVLKNAPHKENAIKFLEYLASNDAQRYFADGNNEWPVVPSVQVANPALDAFGKFKIDPMPIATYGKNTAAAQRLADTVDWR